MEDEKKLILIVEDNPFMQSVITQYLKKMGHVSHIASTGAEALEMHSRNEYSLIFLDCQIPILSGYEVAREIRKREDDRNQTKTPIIACTANTMDGDRERCLEAGMSDHITKPVDDSKMQRILMKWL
ncbi:MAG: hypothetical protein COV36_04155 [Alphaproteobacteria bacterium CG11_big_fil_rev_8_21_14_0_20_44_7]|nr:MAG: hypothetical protein COV36_04155 [Alphaproteobacteria bacterium CG11_big_fil_rev_8_21_14_0_20_44_7]